MELKVFTLQSCSRCPLAKSIVSEVAREFGLAYREVDLGTKEGLSEGLAYHIMGAPSIAIDDEVVARARLISKEKLAEEVRRRLEKWKSRASAE
ncbi:MAG: thioredoxin family protein [Candidatus Bathyarchaeia archaeon]